MATVTTATYIYFTSLIWFLKIIGTFGNINLILKQEDIKQLGIKINVNHN